MKILDIPGTKYTANASRILALAALLALPWLTSAQSASYPNVYASTVATPPAYAVPAQGVTFNRSTEAATAEQIVLPT